MYTICNIVCSRLKIIVSTSVCKFRSYVFFGVAIFLVWMLSKCQLPYTIRKPMMIPSSERVELQSQNKTIRPSRLSNNETQVLQCPNVLDRMFKGNWATLSYGEQDMDDLQYFLNTSRSQHSLPHGLQRKDTKCGNVTFAHLKGKMHTLLWFRALCDPDGDTPCCYNNQCLPKSVESCKCDECYDLRQPVNAEFAEWKPVDKNCKMTRFSTRESVCHVLQNTTIYIVGDSFLRHVYISLLYLLRQSSLYGPFRQSTPPDQFIKCTANKQFAYLEMCRNYIDGDTWECGHTVKLKFKEHASAGDSKATLATINEIRGKDNSFLFIGIGIHYDFNAPAIISQLLQPMHSSLSPSPWPRVLWSAMHAPGLLKTPRVPSQNRDSILRYNTHLTRLLQQWGIPIFDSFNITDGTTSYDGAHYGKGVNDVKAQVLLNYILELREKHLIN